jgi:hypothetical protein
MGDKEKDTTPSGSVIIGRDANGNAITIDNSIIKDILNKHPAHILEKQNKLPKWVYWVWLISIVALGLSLSSIFWGYDITWNVEILSTAILLTFIGILATFVVVSNYVQVKDVKDEFKNVEIGLKKEIKEYNDKEIKSAIGLSYLDSSLLSQMSFGWEPNVVIGYLTSAIKPILESQNENLLKNLIDIIENHSQDSRVFYSKSLSSIIYNKFLNEFKLLLGKDERVYDLLQEIKKLRTV